MQLQEKFISKEENIAGNFSNNINCAFGAACATLDYIPFGLPRREHQIVEGKGGDLFVESALEAYTIIDLNPPGALMGTGSDFSMKNTLFTPSRFPFENMLEQHQPSNSSLTIEYDLEKRLEFWEWWLTEAIPQAWELAQQAYSSNPDKQS